MSVFIVIFEVIHNSIRIPKCVPFLSTVVLSDIKFKVLKHIIDYIYNGDVIVNDNQKDEFMVAAKRYQLIGFNNAGSSARISVVNVSPSASSAMLNSKRRKRPETRPSGLSSPYDADGEDDDGIPQKRPKYAQRGK